MGRLLVLIQLAAQSSSVVGKDLLQGCAEVIGEISSGPRPVLLRWFPFARLDPQRPLTLVIKSGNVKFELDFNFSTVARVRFWII